MGISTVNWEELRISAEKYLFSALIFYFLINNLHKKE